MKVKVSEATGPVLDWMVEYIQRGCQEVPALRGYNYDVEWRNKRTARYSTYWAQGGPIIEREMREHGFDVWRTDAMPECAASYTRGVPAEYVFGPTPLTAAMRCFVTSKLGDEVDVPEELS